MKQCGTEVGSKVTPENTEKIVLQYQGGKIPEDQLELTAQMPQVDGAPFKDVFRDMMRQQFPSGKKKEK